MSWRSSLILCPSPAPCLSALSVWRSSKEVGARDWRRDWGPGCGWVSLDRINHLTQQSLPQCPGLCWHLGCTHEEVTAPGIDPEACSFSGEKLTRSLGRMKGLEQRTADWAPVDQGSVCCMPSIWSPTDISNHSLDRG